MYSLETLLLNLALARSIKTVYCSDMKLAVIGANGRSGRAFVQTALSEGHTVVAGVHRTNPFEESRRLTVMTCDAANPADVLKLCKGADAVVSLIGHVKGSEPDVQTKAMTITIAVMKKLGIKRFVTLTGTGVRFRGDRIPLYDRFLNLGVSLVDPARIRDGKKAIEILKDSPLDWTALRVLKLQDWKTRDVTLTEHGPTALFVNRHDVAMGIIYALEGKHFIKNAPILSKRRRS